MLAWSAVLLLLFALPAVAQDVAVGGPRPSSSAVAKPAAPVLVNPPAARAVPATAPQLQLSFAPLVRQAAPAVVNIYTRKTVQRALPLIFSDPVFRQFFGGRLPQGLSRERVENSLGSGVLVQAQGVIVTSHHVIEGADEITVVLADRREFPARVLVTDPRTDLAVLRIDPQGEALPSLALGDSDALQPGDLVLAIGNPFGVGQTVTSGIVSANARSMVAATDFNFFIQTDAAINPGNSGGALLGMDGRLLGINSAIYSRDGGSLGIGFAVPAAMVRTVLNAALAGQERVKRPWLGIAAQDVDAELAAALQLPRPIGTVVRRLHRLSPLRAAGLQAGDVIIGLDDQPIDNSEALQFRVGTLPIDSSASVQFLRQGRALAATVGMIAAPDDPPRELTTLRGGHPLAGARVANLSPALAEELGLSAGEAEGVIVVAVVPDTPAAAIGLQTRDRIVAINNSRPILVRELNSLLARPAPAWRITINRAGQMLEVNLGG